MIDISRSSMGLDKLATAAVFAAGLLLCMMVTWSFSSQINQGMVAVLLASLLIAIGLITPITSIVITFVYLALLGDIRRLFVYQTGAVVDSDPLLVVAPAVAIGLVLTPFAKGKLDFNTGLNRLVFALALIMLLEVFNPYQGGLVVGLAGGLFYLVPLVWYFIGNTYGNESTLRMLFYRVVVPVGIAGALLGLWQTFVDFPGYQSYWIELVKQRYGVIFIGDRVRPFSFFVSPAEFAHYCMVLTILCLAPLFMGKVRPVVVMALLGMAGIVVQGGRGQIVTCAVGLVVMYAALGRTTLAVGGRFAIALIVAVGCIVIGLMSVSDTNVNEKLAPMLARQQGLLNPLDQRESTFVDHIQIGLSGLVRGVQFPFGQGLGATTIAGRYATDDDSSGGSTEMDITDMFAALGLAGGILYLVIVSKVLIRAWKLVQYRRSLIPLIILGLLVAQFLQWLNGQQYALAALTWFTIGSMERQYNDMERELAEEAAAL